jgi:hypothetical protein
MNEKANLKKNIILIYWMLVSNILKVSITLFIIFYLLSFILHKINYKMF